MTPERWQQVKEIFSRASELETGALRRFLDDECGNDADLRGEVESLLAAHQAPQAHIDGFAADQLQGGSMDSEEARWLGQRVGAYELIALLGRGGMGDVYRARRADAHYQKEVAIKLVRGAYSSEFVLQRFKAERQILASLDHPNIARLLDGGATEDRVPYLVMELIDGRPIDAFCEERKLAVAERLRLFRDVCAAVSDAHRHLVVHRDLKPANILVTADGSIKLLDFGIAKLLQDPGGSPADATRTSVLALTPAFASPEQILGSTITTASDVYSLGVVLFHLLTGRSPYQKALNSTQDAIKEICETEIAAPSTMVSMARDLDDIVLMALRKEPDKRYRSVEQFSEDIQRYLTGMPVSAHRGRVGYRAAKFAKRHKVEIGAAALVALSLIGGVIAATHQAHIAQAEKIRAERDFDRTRRLANSLIFELHDSIRDLPGATSARKLLVERALQYLDSLAHEVTGDVTLQRDLAAAYQRIGDVQGKPFATNLGDTPGALRSYAAALALRETVFKAHHDSLADGVALAEILRLHADALSMSGGIQAAVSEARRAVATAEPITRAHPNDRDSLEELTLDYADLAGILGGNFNSANLNDQAAALAAHENQVAAARRLVTLDGSNSRYQSLELLAEFNMGDQLLVAGQIREATAYYRGALGRLVALTNQTSAQTDLERLHAAYTRLQFVQFWNRDAQGAAESGRAAFALATKLTAQDAKDAYARLDLASDYASLGDALSQLGDVKQALVDAAKAVELLGAMVAADPTNSEYRVTDGLAVYLAGEVAARRGDRADALRSFREALAIFEKVRAEDPKNIDASLHVASAWVKVADMLVQSGEDKPAAAGYRNALTFAGGNSSAEQSDEARYAIAAADLGLSSIETRMGDRRAACDWYTRGAGAWAAIKEPGAISPNGFYSVSPELLRRGQGLCQ